jgi:predicted ArsR family transcriptional regulator
MPTMPGEKGRKPKVDNPLFGTSKGKILALLCSGRHTVAELAAHLGVTDNAVRAQIQRLERDGLVLQAGSRRGVRKPHVEYDLAPKAYALFPRAYEPVLQKLVDVLAERLSQRIVQDLLTQAGRRLLSAGLGEVRSRSPQQRLAEIMRGLDGSSLGIEVGREDGKTVVRSCSCPLSSVTATHPELCETFAGVLGALLRAPVRQKCVRGQHPRCRFEMVNGR